MSEQADKIPANKSLSTANEEVEGYESGLFLPKIEDARPDTRTQGRFHFGRDHI